MAQVRDTSIRRGLDVLMTLHSPEARAARGLGVSHIAQILGQDKSQVSRSLKVLTEYGLVDRDPKTRAFRLGWRIFSLAQQSGDQRLVECAGDVLDRLIERVDESVYVSALSGFEAVTLIERVPNHVIQAMSVRWDLHSTSVGRVLLTGKSSDEIRTMYANHSIGSAAPDGAHDLDQLIVAIDVAREQGYAVVRDEFEVGLTAVGVPVHDYRGVVVAAIGVSGPTFRFGSKVDVAIEAATKAARELEDLLAAPSAVESR